MAKLHANLKQPNTAKVKVACGTLFITVGFDLDGRLRFFFNVSTDTGGCQANLLGLAKSATLFYNDKRFNPQKLIEEWENIMCPSCQRWKGKLLGQGKSIEGLPNSCPHAVAQYLKELEIIWGE